MEMDSWASGDNTQESMRQEGMEEGMCLPEAGLLLGVSSVPSVWILPGHCQQCLLAAGPFLAM